MTAGRRRSPLLSTAIVALVCAVACALQPAQGQSVTGSGDVTPGLTSPNWNVGGDLTVGNTATGTLDIENGGTVTSGVGAGAAKIGNHAGGNGTVTVSGTDGHGSASTWTNNDDLVVAQDGTGTLNITNGGKVSNVNGYVGADGTATGTVTVSGSSSDGLVATWSNSSTLYVGDLGTGTLNILAGGTVSNAIGNIGNQAGSNGTVLVSGNDGNGHVSTWTSAAQINIGNFGTGTLTIDSGGQVISNQGVIGGGAGGSGMVMVTGTDGNGHASAWAAADNIYVGFHGNGALTVADGAAVSTSGTGGGSAAIYIGFGSGTTGTVMVSSSTAAVSTLTASDQIDVGVDGAGTLTVQNGGFVSAANTVFVANGAGSGTLNVLGDTSGRGILETGQVVNANGGGILNLDGGILRANSDQTDFLSGFTALTIGSNGAWFDTNGHQIDIGTAFSGSASFNKLGLGTLTLTGSSSYTGQTDIVAGVLQIAGGGQINGTATAFVDGGGLTVTGTGSAFTTPGDLLVGRGTGTASVTVADGGHLTTGRSFIGEGGAVTTATTLTATVTGPGSVWDAGDGFFLGAASGSTSASLTISNGGVMRAQSAVSDSSIGIYGVAVATVTDTNSELVVGGSTPLTIGELAGGAGTLTINNGGLVIAPTVLMGAFDPTAAGILNLDGTPGAQGVLQTASLTQDAGSGTVNFDGGILRATADNTAFLSGFAPGAITIGAGGAFIDSNGFAITASSDLNGSGALSKEGAGTLTLTGTNSYMGGTVISAGTLQLGNGGTAGSIQGDVADNGTLAFNRTDAVSFSGVVSGSGAVSQAGSGSTTLTGVNTYTGGTVIAGGTLIGSATSFGSGAILDNAALVISQPVDAAFTNAINGTGSFAKQGAGRLNYTGTGNLSGPTTVAAGTLSVNGSLMNSAVTVQNGGTLGGNGTVGATTILAGGAIAPGNSLGTLHINGAYSQAAGGIYQVQVDPNSNASDLIAVNGAATLAPGAGINVTKIAPGDYSLGTIYTILTTTNGVTGTYTLAGDTALTPYIALKDSYDANNAYLKVVQTGDPGSAAVTPNQTQTATGTDSLPGTSGVGSAVLNTPDPGTTRSAFDQLSGEALASAKSALISGSLLVRDTTFDRLRDVFCAGASDEPRRPDRRDVSCPPNPDRATVWTQGFGSWGNISGNGNAAALSESVGGFLIGVDMPVYDWRMGYFGGFSRADFSVKARSSSGNSNNYHLGLYGGTQWGDLGLRLGVSYSWNDLASDRSVTVGDLSNDLRAKYNAGTTQLFGELGQRFTLDRFRLEPFANMAYVNLRTGGFSETGGDAALTVKADTMEDAFTTLGVRPSTDIVWGSFNATARGMVGWRHAFGDVTPSSAVSFAGSDVFTVTGAPIARDSGVVEAGLDFIVHDNVTAGLTYGGQFGSRETDHSIRGTVAIRF
jgi:fibronectin-binding autotransporter adhesin